jgi:transglutaminase/protease-like cytokinesis protein 3
MKKLIIILCVLLGITSVTAQNTDSLVYFDQDTTGLAKSIANDEAAWTKPETFAEADHSRVDNYVLQIKGRYKNIPSLAKDITQPFTTDEDKVRAIFRWMTNNIAYDCKEYHNKNRSIGGGISYNKKTTKQEKAGKWEDVYFRYATRVLRSKKGICEGYATLFYELCIYSGVQCEVITGKADGGHKEKPKFSGHAWNKVGSVRIGILRMCAGQAVTLMKK